MNFDGRKPDFVACEQQSRGADQPVLLAKVSR